MKTIKEIALEAKVSVGTVDRVLHQRGGVSKPTEERIRKIIEDSGFKPNQVARSLKLQQELRIVVLMPSFSETSPFWDQPKKGMEKAIEEVSFYGVGVEIIHFDQFDPRSFTRGLERIFQMENLSGIIIAPHFTKELLQHKKGLDAMGVPYLFLNVDLKGFDNVSFVGQDSYQSGYLAARLFHLSQSRNSTVLLVEVMEDIKNYYGFDNRIKGFYDYFEENMPPLTIAKLKLPKYEDGDHFKKILTQALVTEDQVKGIFLPSSTVNKVAKYLEEFDIAMDTVVGYDLTEDNMALMRKGHITFLISQEPFDQGYTSIKMMFEHLVNGKELDEKYPSPIQVVLKENLDYYSKGQK